MPSNRGQSGPSASASLPAMLSLLRERCPVLCPSVVPSGLADSEQNIGLLALCADTDEKRALATLLQSVRATKRACALTAREADDEGALRFVSQWELDADAGTYRLRRCDFVCAEAALLLDTAALLERFSRADADSKELTRLAQTFSAVNQGDGEPARGAVDAKLWLQECLGLAAACQVIASNLPQRWKVVGPDDEPLAGRSVLSIAKAMLEPQAAGKKGGGGKAAKRRPAEAAEAEEEAAEPEPAVAAKKKRKRVRHAAD